jgi:hypothetical protein
MALLLVRVSAFWGLQRRGLPKLYTQHSEHGFYLCKLSVVLIYEIILKYYFVCLELSSPDSVRRWSFC